MQRSYSRHLLCIAFFLLSHFAIGQQSPTALLTDKSAVAAKAMGEAVYAATCQWCHDAPGAAAPGLLVLSAMTPRSIFATLKTGKMQSQAATLSDEQRRAVAEWITKRPYQETRLPTDALVPFSLPKKVAVASGWGGNLEGTGFVRQAGITKDNAGSLKVKWVFAFPESSQIRSKPAVVSDWLIVGSQFGDVFAIQKETGKVGWQFVADAAIRGAIFVEQRGSALRAYFADQVTNVYALDVRTGSLLWKKRAGIQAQSANTGSVVVYDNVVIVPLTSREVSLSRDPKYPCCTSSGEVVALSATNGDIRWRHRVVPEEATEQGKKSNGQPFYGPSGAPVWSSPTIDARRGLVYIGTGENYTYPATATSDAIQALDIRTGKVVWSFQATHQDTWNLACPGGPNCPEKVGPDLDFGMAPILVRNTKGGDMLLAGQKSGVIHALNPDTGTLIWQTRVGKGGMYGGIHWGMATDGQYLYAANSDHPGFIDPRDPATKPRPGLFALDVATGKIVWHTPAPPCGEVKGCLVANSAAPTLVRDVVFAGGLDGHIRGYRADDGAIIWDFDTVREFTTLNGLPGKGGAIDGPGPVADGNRLYVNSGYAFFGAMPGNVLIAFEVDKR
ncbi:PQQ-binding-like beta-propeller repeat protein [Nibrella viscosa]|uniref:PQQ-binding-like beta-propeller repeat protein n=1 Tax=Nibrella viscosa TaxID=1084524 RepID=A0ABP8K239_9BACT